MAGNRNSRISILIVLLALAFAFSTVFTQFQAYPGEFIRLSQLLRHREVIENKASNPQQYRLLSEWCLEVILKGAKRLRVTSPLPPFFVFRLIQNFFLFLLAASFYRTLGLRPGQILLGLALAGWGVSYAFRDSDLEVSAYSDAVFYLLVVLLIIKQKDWLVPVVAFLAALNRETSFLIPLAYLVLRFPLGKGTPKPAVRPIAIFALTTALYLGAYFGLRLHFGWRPFAPSWKHYPGWDMLSLNLGHTLTWAKLIWTMNVLPVFCFFTYPTWPRELKRLLWAVIPIWFVFHFCYLHVPESRMALVPLVLIFIPGALLSEALTSRPVSRIRMDGSEGIFDECLRPGRR